MQIVNSVRDACVSVGSVLCTGQKPPRGRAVAGGAGGDGGRSRNVRRIAPKAEGVSLECGRSGVLVWCAVMVMVFGYDTALSLGTHASCDGRGCARHHVCAVGYAYVCVCHVGQEGEGVRACICGTLNFTFARTDDDDDDDNS